MSENNNVIEPTLSIEVKNLIDNISAKYGLTDSEKDALYQKYKHNPKTADLLQNEINNLGNYFAHQHKLTQMKQTAPSLENGKNYYVTAFDKNSNIFLQPVSVTITNPETSEVLVENAFKGNQKHTAVDDIEIAICQVGKLLNFDIVEEYHLYGTNKEKDSIIIKDIVNENEFYDVDNLKKRFTKLIANGKLKKEKWFEISETLTVANTKEDYKFIIDYGLNILKSLPSILEEDYQKIEKKYFEMLLFDCLINQSERDFKDYGIICDKVTKRYRYAPLFDNVFPSILKNNDVISVNGITCNRYVLVECLFYNYYDKIKDKVAEILRNKDLFLKNIDIILKYNVDLENYVMLSNNIITNINYFERLNNEINMLNKNKENGGYVSIVQLVLGLAIIVVFSIFIAYLLYTIK